MGYSIREMTAADVQKVAALHVATFNETHTVNNDGPTYALRQSQWRKAFASPDDWFGVVIEDEAGELVGFAKGTLHDGGVPGYQGELNKIYLLRPHHRRGLGRLMLGEVARRFLDRGINSMLLFGDARSSTNGFYEEMGGQRILSESGEFHGGYGWTDLAALVERCGR